MGWWQRIFFFLSRWSGQFLHGAPKCRQNVQRGSKLTRMLKYAKKFHWAAQPRLVELRSSNPLHCFITKIFFWIRIFFFLNQKLVCGLVRIRKYIKRISMYPLSTSLTDPGEIPGKFTASFCFLFSVKSVSVLRKKTYLIFLWNYWWPKICTFFPFLVHYYMRLRRLTVFKTERQLRKKL